MFKHMVHVLVLVSLQYSKRLSEKNIFRVEIDSSVLYIHLRVYLQLFLFACDAIIEAQTNDFLSCLMKGCACVTALKSMFHH